MAHLLLVSVSSIECLHKSAELDKNDEVYCMLRLFAASVKDGKVVQSAKAIQAKCSEISRNIKKGFSWEPIPAEYSFDLGDSQAFALDFSLVEADNKKIYQAVKSGDTEVVFQKPDVEAMLTSNVNSIAQNIQGAAGATQWINYLVSALQSVFANLSQDDLLGSKSFEYAVKAENKAVKVTFDLKKKVANYRVTLEMSILDKNIA